MTKTHFETIVEPIQNDGYLLPIRVVQSTKIYCLLEFVPGKVLPAKTRILLSTRSKNQGRLDLVLDRNETGDAEFCLEVPRRGVAKLTRAG